MLERKYGFFQDSICSVNGCACSTSSTRNNKAASNLRIGVVRHRHGMPTERWDGKD